MCRAEPQRAIATGGWSASGSSWRLARWRAADGGAACSGVMVPFLTGGVVLEGRRSGIGKRKHVAVVEGPARLSTAPPLNLPKKSITFRR
jgi:hypothetical protein